jgi:hypothetical protein
MYVETFKTDIIIYFLHYFTFICNLDIFPLISPRHIVSSNELTLVLKIIGQYDIKHIMDLIELIYIVFYSTNIVLLNYLVFKLSSINS